MIPERIKRIWHDPVWSNVIAVGIVGGVTWLTAHYWNLSVPLWSLVLLIGIMLGLGLGYAPLRRRAGEGDDHAEITPLDTDPMALPPIKIIYPLSGDTLSGSQSLGSGRKFPVRGTLRSKPQDHEVWLLIQDDNGDVWPQFNPAIFEAGSGVWSGWIDPAVRSEVRIIAVVAPPDCMTFSGIFRS